MRAICTKVAAHLPHAEPGLDEKPWLTYWNYITAVAARADASGGRALVDLQVPVYDLGSNLSGTDLINARTALIDSLNRLNRKCLAVGSHVVQ